MSRSALILAAAYLLGSIPFGYLLVLIFRGEDVRRTGSGNIGATNVSRKSPVLGALTLILRTSAEPQPIPASWLPQPFSPSQDICFHSGSDSAAAKASPPLSADSCDSFLRQLVLPLSSS
jgi:hypothetical protein